MKILILGGAGFIGRSVDVELSTRGYEVVVADRQLDTPLLGDDLSHREVAKTLIGKIQPDVVLHLAASPGRAFCELHRRQAISDNVTATMLVARACGEAGVKLIYTSSSEVYGDYGTQIVDESYVTKPTSGLYGLTKWWGEHLCGLYAPADLLILRPLMIYGPGQRAGRGWAALPTFIQRAIDRKPITVHKGAERSWCYVTDAARAISDLLDQGAEGTWNIGRDDESVSMLQVAHRACNLAGYSASLIKEVEAPELQTVIKRVSCAKIGSIGWRPMVDLDEGMDNVYRSML